METSVIYSMGTALSRAQSQATVVEILVGAEWLTGLVVGYDGHGVVLETEPREHVVVRMDAVSAVRVHSRVPQQAATYPRSADEPERRHWAVPAQASAF